MEWLSDPNAWLSLVTLTALEIVLGIDNIIFIGLAVNGLPARQRHKARIAGLWLAMLTRIALLLSLNWVVSLTAPLLTLFEHSFSGRDLVLLAGGLFLLAKSTHEIHAMTVPTTKETDGSQKSVTRRGMAAVLLQIAVLDLVFSLDSVITAVGMAEHLEVMVLAVLISVVIMMVCARAINEFVDRHPSLKLLALSFLILIAVALVADAFSFHIPKAYIYFAMAFSLVVELLNVARSGRTEAERTPEQK